jgi:hypothetical protein
MKRRYKLAIWLLAWFVLSWLAPLAWFFISGACDSDCGPSPLMGTALGILLVLGVVGSLIWALRMENSKRTGNGS